MIEYLWVDYTLRSVVTGVRYTEASGTTVEARVARFTGALVAWITLKGGEACTRV